jgi:hypothetical protein
MAKDKVSISIEIEKIGRGLQEVKGEIQALGKQSQTATAAMNKGFNTVTKGISAVGLAIKAIPVMALITAVHKIAGLPASIIKTGTAFETLKFQLRAVSSTIKEADADFEMIRQFAAKTPFMTQNVTQAFIMLKAVGLQPTTKEMETFGNVAFAMGRDITDVAQSIIALETEVLRRLGIQLDRTGKKAVIMSGDMRVEVENSINAIRDAVIDVWEKRFPGAMKEAEKSWKGLAALLASEWDELKALLAESILPTMKDVVVWLIKATQAVRDYFAAWREGTRQNLERQLEAQRQKLAELRKEASSFGAAVEKIIDPMSGLTVTVIENTQNTDELNKQITITIGKINSLRAQIDALDESEKKNIETKKKLREETQKLAEEARKWAEGVALKAAIKEQEALEAWLGELDPLIAKHGELKEAIDETAKAAEWAAEVRMRAAIKEQEALDEWLEDLDQWKAKHGELAEETKKTTRAMGELWEDFQSNLQWSLEAGFFDLFKGEMDDIGDYFRQFCESLLHTFARAVAKMIAEWLIFKAATIVSHKGEGGNWGWIGQLLGSIFGGLTGGGGGGTMQWGYEYQHGGLINEPIYGVGKSGRQYLFGEAGTEVVTPAYALSSRRERDLNIYLVDERAKTPTPSKDDIVLVISEDIQRGGPVRKTIKRFT